MSLIQSETFNQLALLGTVQDKRAAILEYERQLKEMPQILVEARHYIAGGMYARELFMPKSYSFTGKIHLKEPGLKDHSYYSYIATGATAEPPTAQSGTDTVIHFMATPDSVVTQGLPSTSNPTDSLVGVNTNGRWGLVGKNTLSYWGLSGTSGTGGTGVLGTIDAQPFSFISNNITRATLSSAGQLSTTDNMLINGAKVGSGNESTSVVLGVSALASTTSANANVAIGYNSMNLLTSSIGNVAVGYNSMGASAVTGGNNNTIGSNSAGALTSGQRNNMYGAGVGNNLTTGSYNNFFGYRSGLGIVTGSYNTVLGNIEGLPSDLYKNIIIGDGFGNRRINGDSSGNIGINTITPTQRLHVNGRVRIDTLTSGAATDSIVVWSPTDSTLKKRTMASLTALSSISAATTDNTVNGGGYNFALDNTNSLLLYGGSSAGDNTLFSASSQLGQIISVKSTTKKSRLIASTNGLAGFNKSFIAGAFLDIAGTNYYNILDSNHLKFKADTASYMGGSLGIGTLTPVASALTEMSSTTQGFLPPRMTTTQKNAISSPAEGLIVYDLTLHKLCVYTGSAWETITSLSFEWLFWFILLPTLLFRRRRFYESINLR